jgi:hypothetical protein
MIDVKELKLKLGKTTKDGKTKRTLVKVNPESIRMPKYHTRAAQVACPRSVEDVYSLGISLQNYISSLYLELSESKTKSKKSFTRLMVKQVMIKKEIEKRAKDNLNQLLTYFYENGGPIIEPPLSEETASDLQPYINFIVNDFLNHLHTILDQAADENVSASDIDDQVDRQIIMMFRAMGKLVKNDKMQNAFDEIINLRNR